MPLAYCPVPRPPHPSATSHGVAAVDAWKDARYSCLLENCFNKRAAGAGKHACKYIKEVF